jgi:hypothetical protein
MLIHFFVENLRGLFKYSNVDRAEEYFFKLHTNYFQFMESVLLR